jgi:hypothetical protein
VHGRETDLGTIAHQHEDERYLEKTGVQEEEVAIRVDQLRASDTSPSTWIEEA